MQRPGPAAQPWTDACTGARTRDEEEVEVIGSGGRVRMTLRVRDAIVPGTICIEGIHWPKLTAGGRGVNELTLQRETDFGGGATFYDVTVRVQPADDG